ncbi:MAG: acetyl-CoA carboxylase biotin carboxyl carrier protein [Sedimentisphaerales bacterium]|nr:acetyl-CoA carboxylase biotin carboxyl carrier protein [Sedimentisphaerales bacterium]
MAKKDAELQRIEKLIQIMKDNDLAEVEIQNGDEKILIKRSQSQRANLTAIPMIAAEPSKAAGAEPAVESVAEAEAGAIQQQEELIEIQSPIVGTFYEGPSPDSEPYVEVGSEVSPQMVVCIIEAMKVMNEIKAQAAGAIVEKLVTNGQAVEFGQVLFKVKPD